MENEENAVERGLSGFTLCNEVDSSDCEVV